MGASRTPELDRFFRHWEENKRSGESLRTVAAAVSASQKEAYDRIKDQLDQHLEHPDLAPCMRPRLVKVARALAEAMGKV